MKKLVFALLVASLALMNWQKIVIASPAIPVVTGRTIFKNWSTLESFGAGPTYKGLPIGSNGVGGAVESVAGKKECRNQTNC